MGKIMSVSTGRQQWGKSRPSVPDSNNGENHVRQYRTASMGEIMSVSIGQQQWGKSRPWIWDDNKWGKSRASVPDSNNGEIHVRRYQTLTNEENHIRQ